MDGESEDTFVRVKRKRKRRVHETTPFDFSEVLSMRRRSLATEDWLNITKSWVEGHMQAFKIARVICLGLGSFGAGGPTDETTPVGRRKSQLQLLLLTDAIAPMLANSGQSGIEAYDPAFSHEDKVFLQSAGCSPLDEEPTLGITQPTLFYMPHAPRSLYEKVLRENPTSLRLVFVLGNSLATYRDRPDAKTLDAIPCILEHGPQLREEPMPVPKRLEDEIGRDVFNETSLQWLPRSRDDDAEGLTEAVDNIRI